MNSGRMVVSRTSGDVEKRPEYRRTFGVSPLLAVERTNPLGRSWVHSDGGCGTRRAVGGSWRDSWQSAVAR
jgi:hypothetical protein